MSNPQHPKRPFGVTAIVILQLITISFVIIYILVLLIATGLLDIPLPEGVKAPSLPAGSDPYGQLISLTVILIYTVTVAVGLWRLKRWAWFLLMIQLGFDMVLGLWSYFYGEPAYFRMLTDVIYVLYLNMHEVQQAFGHEPTRRETTWTT
ncbi:MAG: hypothetical protein KDJ97_08660 [Anaerolineae bacterium]|nr:hypothetical protein [Anaerolineae bacterium]